MLFKRKQEIVKPEIKKQEIETSTPQLVKQLGIIATDYYEDDKLRHDYKLSQVIGQDSDNPIGYWGNHIEKLFDLGFIWFINSVFVSKFKYAAQVGGSGAVYADANYRSSSTISYIGDIPDYAIERYNVAKKSRLFDCFSVHSNEPLLVMRGTRLDPVLIGWSDPPAIRVNEEGVFVRCSNKCVGVVIAIWDKEKELEVL